MAYAQIPSVVRVKVLLSTSEQRQSYDQADVDRTVYFIIMLISIYFK